jgi:hypothetical protein
MTVWGGAIVIPEKTDSNRAIITSCDTVSLGFPASLLAEVDTGCTADLDVQMGECYTHTHSFSVLPHVSSLMARSASILSQHRAMTQVRHMDTPEGDDGTENVASEGGGSSGGDEGAREEQRATASVRRWLNGQMMKAISKFGRFRRKAHAPKAHVGSDVQAGDARTPGRGGEVAGTSRDVNEGEGLTAAAEEDDQATRSTADHGLDPSPGIPPSPARVLEEETAECPEEGIQNRRLHKPLDVNLEECPGALVALVAKGYQACFQRRSA